MITIRASDYGIEVERKAKLLEDISSISRDYSYSFEMPNTQENRSLLGIKVINSLAFWNTTIPAQVVNDSGATMYTGYVQIEGEDKQNIRLSFYSGNTDWFNLLNVNLLDLNYSRLNKDWTSANIVSSWSQNSGIVFPFVNRGGLLTRKSPNYYIDDFQPFLYVKDAINVIMANYGIKMSGDLLNDPVYNSLITTNNSFQGIQRRVNQQKVKAGNSSNQVITKGVETKINFTNVSTPYFNSPQNNFNTTNSQYVFSESARRFTVKVNLNFGNNNFPYKVFIRIFYNTSLMHEVSYLVNSRLTAAFTVNSFDFNKSTLYSGAAAGGTIEVRVFWGGPSTTLSVFENSFIEVQPTKFYMIEATQCLPDMKARDFVKQVFSLFNVVSAYNAETKTLEVKKMDSVIKEEPIDISEYIQRDSIEYFEFIQNYAQNNYLRYQDQTFEEVNRYNISDRVPYGHGRIKVLNDFIDESSDLLNVDFIAAWQQEVDFLGSLPRLEYVEMVETDDTREVTSVTDNGGTARFNFTGAGVGLYMVRVSNSSVESYNGDYNSNINISGYTELEGVLFDGNATCKITVLDWEDKDNDDQTILIHKPSVPLSDIGYGGTIEGPNGVDYSTVGIAFFHYPDRGTRFSRFNGVGLPFDSIDGFQKGLTESYWRSAQRLITNGILLKYTAFLPETVFNSIDFLRPVRIVTEQDNMIYLVNRITGYKGSEYPCEMELINIQNVSLDALTEAAQVEPEPPPPDPVPELRYYIADIYECGTCTLLLTGQIVEATSVSPLALNRWYATGTEVAFIYNTTGSGPSAYTVIDNSFYASCAIVPCLAPP
jgi:hypothetical protein